MPRDPLDLPVASAPNDIYADLAAGERPISLSELVSEKFVPRPGGRKLHISWAYRAEGAGLETAKISGIKYTTASAYLRWVAKSSGKPASPSRSPGRRDRDIDRVERDLAAAGI